MAGDPAHLRQIIWQSKLHSMHEIQISHHEGGAVHLVIYKSRMPQKVTSQQALRFDQLTNLRYFWMR